jgi:hypothetical protein
MKLFECQFCGQPLHFENTHCESCGHQLGFPPPIQNLSAVEWIGEAWTALADPSRSFRFCANAEHDVCNWLIPADNPDRFCVACRHNRVIPNLSQAQNVERWRRLEAAKHRLFYTLLKLDLPLASRMDDPKGLAFDFLSDPAEGTPHEPTVLTGHDNGLITINLAEADDAERERRRHAMGEPYRTLLGHFRHEVGHYYWDVLIGSDPSLARFRGLFGDERQDYSAALQTHYDNGPPEDWRDSVRERLCERSPVGGLGRDLGALPSHGRYFGDRERFRTERSPANDPWAGVVHGYRLRSARRW